MKKLGIMLLTIVSMMGCKKDELEVAPLANVNVVNAVLDGKVLKLNDYLRDSVSGFNGKSFTVKSGDKELNIFPSGEPLNSYFRGRFTFETGGIYSLYLSGTASSPDTLWRKENFPPFYQDNTIGIRFVNLSKDSGPLSLTLASDVNTKLFSNIPYRGVTGFIRLPLPTVVPAGTATYQVYNSDKALVASFALPTRVSSRNVYLNISIPESRNKNLTLVVKGSKGVSSGTNAVGLFPVANY